MIWKLLERFSSQVVSFVISIVLARLLLPSDYGIIAIVLVFIGIANVIIDGGLNTALIQKKTADRTDFSTIFWFCLFIAVILYAVLFLTAPLIAAFYKNDLLTPVLRVLGYNVFFNSFNSIQRAYVSRNMLFKESFYINSVAIVVSGAVGVIMAYKGFGVWALVGQYIISTLVCCVLMCFFISWRPTFEFSFDRFKGLFDFGWKIFLTNFIIAIYDNVRSLVIGKMYKPAVLGFFDRGRTLSNLFMSNISASVTAVLLPALSEEQDNRERVRQMLFRSLQVTYLFVAPLLVFFFFASKEIVLILMTEKWLPCVPFIQIFCIAFLLLPIQSINATAIQSLGYSNLTLKIEIIKKIIEAIILVISFMINVYAVAWGIVLYNAVSIPINLYPSKRLIDYGTMEQIKDVFPTVMTSLLMGGLVYVCELLPFNSFLILTLQIFVGALSYYGLCALFHLDGLQYIREYLKKGFSNKHF